ncbi:response regulator [Paludisphaera soli]|uniref:response regulator n=2 Tax=Paludisphaera soli TaxID=2712865 RepID=UPI0013EBF26B|nr:response regulator [Paludisphaera soli]
MRRSILVVEDNRDLADTQAILLRAAGYRVAIAYDGFQAVAAAQAEAPDLVLLDIGLPGLDGYEVAELLRGDGRTAEAVIVAVSAYDPAHDLARAVRPAFDHRLMKPVTGRELLTFLKSAGRPARDSN